MFRVCNYLPDEAIQSSEAFLDCMCQLLQGDTRESYIEAYKQATLLRSGLWFMNHVGRSYFKYVVEFVLEQYRKLFKITGGMSVQAPQLRIVQSDTFFNIVFDDRLGEAVQAARAGAGTSPEEPIKYVEDLVMSRLRE